MPFGYDPYQKDLQLGSLIGDTGGSVLRFLMMLGMGGTGPLAGMMGGSKKVESPAPTQVPQAGGQGPMAMNIPGQAPPQMQDRPMPQFHPMAGGIPQGQPNLSSQPFPQQGPGGQGGMDPQMIQQLISNPQMMQMIMQLFGSRQR